MDQFWLEMKELFTGSNMLFLLKGLRTTLLISAIVIVLSMVFGSILGICRHRKKGLLKNLAAIYVEIVRNIPNLLWIYIVFLVFQLKSMNAAIVSFTIFTSAALAEIVRGGLNSVGNGQWEAAYSQGLNQFQTLFYIILPQAIRSMLPAIISQMVTVIKDSSFLWSVIAIQELLGKVTILTNEYHATAQIFVLYGLAALVYFLVNFAISIFSRYLSKKWATGR